MASGKGGVTRLIMTDYFSPPADETEAIEEPIHRPGKDHQEPTDEDRKADKKAKKASQKMEKKSKKTFGFKVYALLEHPWWKLAMTPLIYFFIIMEYVDDSAVEFIVLEGFALAVLMFDGLASWRFTWIERDTMGIRQTHSKAIHAGIVMLNAVFLVLKSCGYPDSLRFTSITEIRGRMHKLWNKGTTLLRND